MPRSRTRARAPQADGWSEAIRSLAIGLICARVLTVPLFFDVDALVVFAQPKALLSHGLSVLLAGSVVALAIRGDIAVRRPPLQDRLALGIGAAYVLATLTALDQRLAVFGAEDRALGLMTLIDQLVLYAAIRLLVRGDRPLLALGATIVVTTAAILAYQALQMAGRDPIDWASGLTRARPFSTFGNAGVLGLYLTTVAAACLPIGLLPADARRLDRRLRALVLGLAVTCIVGAYLTGTRAIFLGLGAAAGMLVLWLNLLSGSTRLRAVSVALAAVSMVALAAALALTPLGRSLQSVLVSAPSLLPDRTVATGGTVSGRLDIYRIAISELSDRPLLGIGPDNYVAAFPSYRTAESIALHDSPAPQTSPHSFFLKVATVVGVFGLALTILLLVVAFREAFRSGSLVARAAIVAIAAFLGTAAVSVSDVGTDWLLWVGLAVAAQPGPDRGTEPGRSVTRSPRPSMARSPIVIAVLAVAAFGALATRTAFEAGHLAEDARQLRLRGQAARAAQASARAVELDAGRATYWNGLGLANAADPRHMRDAVTAFGRAADLAPWEVTYLTNLARAQLSLAQAGAAEWRDRALASARLAVERDPQYGEPYFTLSLVVVSSGNARDGIAAFERGIALQGAPRDPQAFYVAGRAYIDLKRFADASSVLRTAILALPEADRIAARFQLARALAAQGQTTEALVELAIVLGADPSNEAARALRDELTRSAP